MISSQHQLIHSASWFLIYLPNYSFLSLFTSLDEECMSVKLVCNHLTSHSQSGLMRFCLCFMFDLAGDTKSTRCWVGVKERAESLSFKMSGFSYNLRLYCDFTTTVPAGQSQKFLSYNVANWCYHLRWSCLYIKTMYIIVKSAETSTTCSGWKNDEEEEYRVVL